MKTNDDSDRMFNCHDVRAVKATGDEIMEKIKKKEREWRFVPGLRGYEVSNWGDIKCFVEGIDPVTRECKDGKVRTFFTGVEQLEKPYELDWKVNRKTNEVTVRVLYKGRMRVRPLNNLVASAFGIEKPTEYASRLVHKNYDPFDFRSCNLVWKRKQKKRNGGPTKQKIDAAIARNIRILLKMGYWAKAIGRQFQISESLVSQIKKGKRWPNAGGPLDDGKEVDETIDKWTLANAERFKHEMMIEYGMIRQDQPIVQAHPSHSTPTPEGMQKVIETGIPPLQNAPIARVSYMKQEPPRIKPVCEMSPEEQKAYYTEQLNRRLKGSDVPFETFVKFVNERGYDLNNYKEYVSMFGEMMQSGFVVNNVSDEITDDF